MDQNVKGSLWGILAFFCMALFGIFTKEALQQGSIYWVSFLSYLCGTCLLVPFISGKNTLASNHYGLLIARALIGTLASFCYTIAIHYIPIVNATLLFNTAPLFIPFLSMIFLKTEIKKSLWIAVLIGFIGIIAIIKPTSALFTQFGNLIGIASGISLAIAYLIMKQLTTTEPAVRIIFYYLGLGSLVQIPLLFHTSPPNSSGVLHALIAGAMLLFAQLSLARGYLFASASAIGVYQYTSVVFVGLISWMFFGSLPSLGDLVGIILVTIAGVIIIRS